MLTAIELDKAQARVALEARRVKHAILCGKPADYSRVLEASRVLDLLTEEYQKLER